MSDNGLKVYEVVIGGVVHTMQYDEAEAKRLGLVEHKVKAAEKPLNKARSAGRDK